MQRRSFLRMAALSGSVAGSTARLEVFPGAAHPAKEVPGIPRDGSSLEKIDAMVIPLDLVRGRDRATRAMQEIVRCEDSAVHAVAMQTLDAPAVAVGGRTRLSFTPRHFRFRCRPKPSILMSFSPGKNDSLMLRPVHGRGKNALHQPDLSGGIHFSLFDNAWGTNYPQ